MFQKTIHPKNCEEIGVLPNEGVFIKKYTFSTFLSEQMLRVFLFFLNTNKFEDANTKHQVLQVVTSFGPTSDLFRAFQGLHLGNQRVTLKKLVEKSKFTRNRLQEALLHPPLGTFLVCPVNLLFKKHQLPRLTS